MKLVCVLALALVAVDAAKVTPTEKVIQLLQNMISKGTNEMNAEQTQFSQYSSWCTNICGEKRRAIKKENEEIEMLQADIQKYNSDALTLGQEIAELDETIATIEGDTRAATKVRDMMHADFLKAQTDYQQSVDALSAGIDTLKAKSSTVRGAAFTQTVKEFLKTPVIPKEAQQKIKAYLEKDTEEADAEALKAEGKTALLQGPAANAYEFQSAAIISMFDEMKDKFEGKVSATEKFETEDNHEYMMLKQDLDNQKATAESSRNTKAEMKAKALQDAADSQGSLADVTGTRDADVQYLSDTDAQCNAKASAFEERTALRKEEIEALGKAIEILGGTPSGIAAKHLPALMQLKGSSFVQLRAAAKNPNQIRVAAYLQDQGKKLQSKVLSVLALRVAADPFKSVKKMIKDMVVKLMEEATEEAEHKGFCDTELRTNEHTRKEKTEAVEILTAEIDQLEASISQTTSEISELTEAVAQLDAAVAEATSIRAGEKAKNTETIADAKEAQVATANAMKVLKDFYDKAASATSMMQTKEGQPEVFSDKPYTGMGGDSGGVIGMIEVIASDFSRLEAETTAEEEQSAKEFTEFSRDSEMDKSSKTSDINHKSAKRTDQEGALTDKKADLAGTQKELDSAMKYYDKLKPQCIETGSSYEDKVAQRKEEIESLQDALRILNGEDLAFLQQ